MNCPIDKEKLEPLIYEDDVEVDQCPKCNGIWLDKGELARIEKSRENDYREIIKNTAYADKIDGFVEMTNNAPLIATDRPTEDNTLNCPSCGDLLYKKEHGFFSKVMIDSCIKCNGIWLDKGELQAIEIFFEKNKPVENLNFWQHFKNGLHNIF
jgi:uncharacterized protein